jgi:hypothetical protein
MGDFGQEDLLILAVTPQHGQDEGRLATAALFRMADAIGSCGFL